MRFPVLAYLLERLLQKRECKVSEVGKIFDRQQGGHGFNPWPCLKLNRRTEKLVQLVRSLTTNHEIVYSIPGLVKGWLEGQRG